MNRYQKRLLSLAVISALGLAACGSDDAPEVVVPPPKPPVVVAPTTPAPIGFVVTGSLVDFTSGDVIANATAGAVTLSFKEGDAASNDIRSLSGTAITTLNTTDGNFAFKLADNAALENFSIQVSAAGYLTKSFVLDLSDTSAPKNFSLDLVSEETEGVAVAEATATVAAGAAAAPVTATATESGASAGITIPAGTVMQTANGTAIAGTSVTLNVATAAKTGAEGAATLASVIPQGLNTETDNLVRVPLAGANIEMTDNLGNKIKKFSAPVNLTLNVPADGELAEGDTVSVSSYDEATGNWTRDEATATLGALDTATNSFPASFQSNHLTFFTASSTVPVCPLDLTYTIPNGTVPAGGLTLYLESSDAIAIGNIKEGTTSGILLRNITVRRYNIGENATATVRLFQNSTRTDWYNSGVEVPICGNVLATPVNPNTAPVNEDFNVNLVCSNDATVTKGLTGALVSYGLPNKAKVQARDNNDGSYSLTNLTSGSSYQVKVEPQGVAGAAVSNFTITANGTEETGTINITCQTATGAG